MSAAGSVEKHDFDYRDTSIPKTFLPISDNQGRLKMREIDDV